MAVRESTVVASIHKVIVEKYPQAWVFKVFGNAFQMSGVPDLLVCIDGLLFGLEVKAPRSSETREAAAGRATALQMLQIKRLVEAGAVAAVVTSPAEALAVIADRLKEE